MSMDSIQEFRRAAELNAREREQGRAASSAFAGPIVGAIQVSPATARRANLSTLRTLEQHLRNTAREEEADAVGWALKELNGGT